MPESKMVRELRVAVFHSPTSTEADLFRRAANQLQRQDDQVAALTAERGRVLALAEEWVATRNLPGVKHCGETLRDLLREATTDDR